MFNWLNRTRNEISQPSQDGYVSYCEMQRQLAEAKERWIAAERAEKIVRAFVAVLKVSSEWILDARKLPYSKEVIRSAFELRIRSLKERCRQQPNNSEFKKDLDVYKATFLRVSDFQTIDTEDEEAVRAANAGGLSDRDRVLLFDKYLERGLREDESVVDDPNELTEKRSLVERHRRAAQS